MGVPPDLLLPVVICFVSHLHRGHRREMFRCHVPDLSPRPEFNRSAAEQSAV